MFRKFLPTVTAVTAVLAAVAFVPGVGATDAQAISKADCPSSHFCVFDNGSFSGFMGAWNNTNGGNWQSIKGSPPGIPATYASSMVNRRNFWTVLEKPKAGRGVGQGDHYCAKPNSEDASLASNGFSNNTTAVLLTSSVTKQATWNCKN